MQRPANEGKDLIESWQSAMKAVEFAKDALRGAETNLTNAINLLGKWMLPRDAKSGEKFSVWNGSELIEVEYTINGSCDFKVKVRPRGQQKQSPKSDERMVAVPA